MRRLAALFIALWAAAPAGAQQPAPPVRDAVATAQALYADARYEEALAAFEALKAAGVQEAGTALAVELGRACCLLALGRSQDADQAIEAILRLDPAFRPSDDDTPPKIRSAFREVRRRSLASVMQQIYERAKAAYERRAFDEAGALFSQVRALLDDPDLDLEAGPRADMRLVARAFEDLVAAASTPSSPQASTTPAGAQAGDRAVAPGSPGAPGGVAARAATPREPGAASQAVAPGPLYDAASADVTPPVPERTEVRMPEALRRTGPTGDVIVELVVSAAGTVESATVRQSPDAVLGAMVARAVMDWRYRPATRAGVPVRYRLMARVVVARTLPGLSASSGLR